MDDISNDHIGSGARRNIKRRALSFVGNNRHPLLVRFGKAIRRRRKQLAWTQAELAYRTQLSRSSISEIEGGKENISLERAARLAEALSCSLVDLLREE